MVGSENEGSICGGQRELALAAQIARTSRQCQCEILFIMLIQHKRASLDNVSDLLSGISKFPNIYVFTVLDISVLEISDIENKT